MQIRTKNNDKKHKGENKTIENKDEKQKVKNTNIIEKNCFLCIYTFPNSNEP